MAGVKKILPAWFTVFIQLGVLTAFISCILLDLSSFIFYFTDSQLVYGYTNR